ncbi:DUF4227 family protein [Paenibacillus segetis]|uniref:DUF4227 domain-containing protein n=1 Tax=Paenibacillus segetis TaxID=1325360 RepID=A0ABQ1YHX6_9BACL|nr:DUF4227 family protein [Paenibacillus segetis]GGH24944.1 hypothetical protein GCM10008013_24940 [Paenibacillus segetis]
MIISLRKCLRALKYLLVFLVLAYAMYRIIGMLDGYIFPMDKYRIPEGSSVKVFRSGTDGDNKSEVLSERLKLFFWYGE